MVRARVRLQQGPGPGPGAESGPRAGPGPGPEAGPESGPGVLLFLLLLLFGFRGAGAPLWTSVRDEVKVSGGTDRLIDQLQFSAPSRCLIYF